MLPTDLRDVHHSRLLEQIRTGNSLAPDVRALHDGAALAVRAGRDVFPYYSDHFFELAFPLLFPYGTSRPCFKRHHALSLERYMKLAMGDASGVWARDPLFCLVAYEVVTQRRLLTGAKLKARVPSYTRARAGPTPHSPADRTTGASAATASDVRVRDVPGTTGTGRGERHTRPPTSRHSCGWPCPWLSSS